MSHMVYEDYRRSALKHLNTCKYMLDNLHHVSNNDLLDVSAKEEWKNNILRNVYYLCGYAIEGVVNYCIFKSVRYPNHSSVKNLHEPNLRRFNNANVTFPYNLGLFFDKYGAGYNDYRHYSIKDHNYCKNIKMLKYFYPQNFNRINIINSTQNNADILSVLFYRWKVELRYDTNMTQFNPNPTLIYNESEIIDFYKFVHDEIYIKLPLLC